MNSSQFQEHPDYCVFRGWAINKCLDGADEKGWIYYHLGSKRKRLWEQLNVHQSQYEKCAMLIPHFHSKFRGINLSFLRRALHSQEYQVQIVLEYQRFYDGVFSAHNLLPSDPPAWASSIDMSSPVDIPLEQLQPFNPDSYRPQSGWTTLHDFIFVTYPTRDIAGWQYAPSFDSQEYSVSAFLPIEEVVNKSLGAENELYPVRRRLWVRTLVRQDDLLRCKNLLSSYIKSHPRGHILATKVFRQSHYRKRWCFGMGLLIDREIHILLDHNYQKHVVYSLEGCEVSVLSVKYRNEAEEGTKYFIPSFLNPNKPLKFYLFGLKHISDGGVADGKGLGGSMMCILSTLTNKDRDLWISALYHQLLLVNHHNFLSPDQYSVKLGPHISDSASYSSGRLWRNIRDKWQLIYVEIREGKFTCYADGAVLDEFCLHQCQVLIPDDLNYLYPFAIIHPDGINVILSSTSSSNRQFWLKMVHYHIDSYSRTFESETGGSSISGWFDSHDIIDRGSSPDEFGSYNLFQHSDEIPPSSPSSSSLCLKSSLSGPLVKYFRDIISPNLTIEPVINMRIESYRALRESYQLSDYDNEEEFYSEFNREESEDSIHSLGKLIYHEVMTKKK